MGMKENKLGFTVYRVVEVNGFIRECIDIKGKPNKYGKPKIFCTFDAACYWVDKHTYPGMSHHYEIVEDSI